MTYGTHITCRFGAPSAIGPAPDRPKPRPTMTWAEMARAEGHAPRAFAEEAPPPKRSRTQAERVLALLAKHGPLPRRGIRDRTGLSAPDARAVEAHLVAAGLARIEAAPIKHQPGRVVLVITEAGRAEAGE